MARATIAPLACALLVPCLGACESDQPPPDVMPQMPTCSSTEQEIANVGDVTPLGSSARTILDRYAAPMVGQLQWSPRGDGYELLFDTGTEPMEVTVSLAYEGGRISYLDQEVVVPDGQVNAIGLECPDELRVEVVLGVSTPGGELAETWATVLVVRTNPSTGDPLEPMARVDVDFADIVGTFAISGIEPTTWSVSEAMRVLVEFSDGGSSGRIQTGVTDPDRRTRAAEFGTWQASAS